MHFFDRHNHKLQIEDFELFIALLERLMAEQIRKQSAQVTTKFQRGNDGYSGVPNNRTYVRSCSENIFPLCTQLLETLYAHSREAKFFKINDFIENKRLFCLKKLIFHL